MTDYKPGTVAKATVNDTPNTLVVRRDCPSAHRYWLAPTMDDLGPGDVNVTDVRPLAVLDAPQVDLNAAAEILRISGFSAIADQIEAQTKPRVAEPQGLGAVVEGREGNRWVRTNESSGFPWRKVGPVDRVSAWALITSAYEPVAVLSEGVTS